MTTLRNLLIGAASAAAFAAMATAAAAAQDSATVSAKIIQPITIAKQTDVNFGTIARPGSGSSTVTLPANGDAESANGTGLVVAAGSRGDFLVQGDAGRSYSLSGHGSGITLSNGPAELTFTPAVAVDTGSLNTIPGSLGDYTQGEQHIYVGGTLPVANTTTAGAYSGTITLTVAYN